jgi:hypothetical protein
VLEIGQGFEAQMIRHMRHGSSPRLMALQPIRVLDLGESLTGPISRSSYHDRLVAIAITAVAAPSFAREMVIHLGIQSALGERLFQIIEKAIRVKGRLGIGPSQELVQNGIRNTRLFASRHVGAP